MPDPLQGPTPSPVPFVAPNMVPNPPASTVAPVAPIANPVPTQTPEQTPPKGKKNILILVLAVLIVTALIGVSMLFIYPRFKKTTSESPITQTSSQTSEETVPDIDLQSTQEAQPDSTNLKFESSDFSIIGPAGWTKITGSAGSLILFQNTEADKDINGLTFGASINVTTDFLSSDMTLDEYAKAANIQRQNTLTGYVPKSQIKGTLAKQSANVDVYLAKIGNIDVQQGQIYTIKNHKAYVITFNTLANSWDKYAKIFNATAQSFQFICNSGTCLPTN